MDLGPYHVKRGRKPKDNSSSHRYDQGKGQDPEIYGLNLRGSRQRKTGSKRAGSPLREQNAGRASGDAAYARQHDALCQ